MGKISEEVLSPSILDGIKGCAASTKELLDAPGDCASIVSAIDSAVIKLQKGVNLDLDPDVSPEYLFGSLWGEQLVRQLQWEWIGVIFHEHDDTKAVGVANSDRSLIIYPFHFVFGCLENEAPVTIALSFNMLLDGNKIPRLEPNSYENVMDNVHHIVPR